MSQFGREDDSEGRIIKIAPESPSIQTHLSIMQGVVQRMASNSSSCKTWCVTLVSAILVMIADKGKPEFAFIALLPTIIFAALDIYYLALEKAFRGSYNDFIKKLHGNTLTCEDLYSVSPKGDMTHHQIHALCSFSVWGFYLSVALLVVVARAIILNT